jgi:hypothetical protein
MRDRALAGRPNEATNQPTARGKALRPVGHRGDAPSLIAKRVQQLACTADVVVWRSEDRIFAAPADAAKKVPPASMIGIYGAGVLLAEIERDLGPPSRRG